jgi:uncharacterized protein (TIGR00730 family)
MEIRNIGVYCGSSTGSNDIYVKAARKLGEYFVKNNLQMVYGAGSVGLMGIIADTMLAQNGKVVGVIPQFLMDLEVGHKHLTEIYICGTMHERKQKMCELSDAIIALPGGFGTLDELFEMLTWSQLNLHQMPIGLLNINNYFNPLVAMVQNMVDEGFLKEENQALLIVDDTIEGLMQKLSSNSRYVAEKWLGRA